MLFYTFQVRSLYLKKFDLIRKNEYDFWIQCKRKNYLVISYYIFDL